MVRQAPVICVMASPIHLGAWSMALMLSKAEKNYSQAEKESLACVFAVKRFHDYFYGGPGYDKLDNDST